MASAPADYYFKDVVPALLPILGLHVGAAEEYLRSLGFADSSFYTCMSLHEPRSLKKGNGPLWKRFPHPKPLSISSSFLWF